MVRAHHVALASLLAGAFSFVAISSPPAYSIEGIGALADLTDLAPTPPTSSATAINEAGEVCGASWISGGFIWINKNQMLVEPSKTHGVVWQDGVLTDVGIPGGDVPPNVFPRPSATAKDINAHGQVVGDADIMDGWYHAFLYLPEPAYGFPAGNFEAPALAVQAKAWAISDAGVIVGESRPTPGAIGMTAVSWTPANGSFTTTNLGANPGWMYSAAYDINSSGEVAGWVQTTSNESHAFLYLPEAAHGLPAGANIISAGFPGSVARNVNDLGQVVGHGPGGKPMVWLPAPAYGLPAGFTTFSTDMMFDQETLDAHGFVATYSAEFMAIGGGIAVGNVTFVIEMPLGDYGFTPRAFAWIDGEFHLLEDLLLPDMAWVDLVWAQDVNESRQIVGSGFTGTESEGYVMTLQAPGDVNGDGQVDVTDLLALLGQWQRCITAICAADFDDDGLVGINDLLILLANWD